MRITKERVAEFENLGSNISVGDLLNVINGLGFNLDIYAEYEDEKMQLCFPPGKEIEKWSANCSALRLEKQENEYTECATIAKYGSLISKQFKGRWSKV